MKKNKHKPSLLHTLLFLFLFAVTLVTTTCKPKTQFERNIPFNKSWYPIQPKDEAEQITVFKKEFDISVDKSRVYLLQFSEPNQVFEASLNNSPIQLLAQGNSNVFYLTNSLVNHNEIIIKSHTNYHDSLCINAYLHCLNKLHIFSSKIENNFSSESSYSFSVCIRLKNRNEYEKQASLKCYLFDDRKKALLEKETPVFIKAKSENSYTQQIELQANDYINSNIKLVCKLFSNNELLDEVTHLIAPTTNINDKTLVFEQD